ncbi:MAG: CatB-related O-acetyltransferase [Rhodospirillaceae bacterium]|nr:CatB-related O-acetyltransferase [Rhodospirillales bacterium]
MYPELASLTVDRVFLGRRSYKLHSGLLSPNVVIGRFCSISHYVYIGASRHPMEFLSTGSLPKNAFQSSYPGPDEPAATIIQNDVWIGMNAMILGAKDIVIGHGACIGAGAVVTKSVPPYAVVAGNPARIIRYRFPELTIERLLAVQWWRLPDETIAVLPYHDIEACLELLEDIRESQLAERMDSHTLTA